MSETFKYVLDHLFLFILATNLTLFLIHFSIDINEHILKTLEHIDFALLGGYYLIFGKAVITSKNKLKYCKTHWMLIIFLILPLFPLARILKFTTIERITALFGDTLWHTLDELELL